MKDTTRVILENFSPQDLFRTNNPLVLAGLLFILLLGATYIFFKYILIPLQHRHYLKEEDLKNKIKIQQMQQAIREQQIRSALFHETVEKERKRMAKELHDGLGSILSGVKLKLETFRYKEKIENNLLEDSIDLLISGGQELRSVIHELQPVEIEKHGIRIAIENQLKTFSQNTGIKTIIHKMDIPEELTEYRQISLFRVLQEILHNIHKHAHASEVEITMFVDSDIFYATVSDNGQGFDVKNTKQTDGKSGYGLNNMIERITNNGGKLEIISARGEGTSMHITMPADLKETAGEEITPAETELKSET